MLKRLRQRWARLDHLNDEDLASAVLLAGDARRVRAFGEMAVRGSTKFAKFGADCLADPTPGVRRAAARALGVCGDASRLGLLQARLQAERCSNVKLAVAVATLRLGGAEDEVIAALEAHAGRTIAGAYGPRQPEAAVGFGPSALVREFRGSLQDLATGEKQAPLVPLEDAGALRMSLLQRICSDPHRARESVPLLALHQDPRDFDFLVGLRKAGGRRTDHLVLRALGFHGDPRAAPLLRGALSEMDVDPGRAFAHRRIAAEGLGRLGLPEHASTMHRCLAREAIEHEGTPGAGMGVQYPVRTLALWALGEMQSVESIPVLVSYLGDDSGSPLGGFYLPAMGALWKLGNAARSALQAVAGEGEGVAAANAEGVLQAIAAGDSQ